MIKQTREVVHMKTNKSIYHKGIVLGIIVLFIGAGSISSISGDNMKENDKSGRIIITLLDEGFESGIPSSWTNTGWILDWYGFAHTGLHWVSNSGGGSYMTTTTLTFGDNTELSFWYAVVDGGEPKNLEVYIDDYTNPSNLIWSDYGFTHTDYQQVTVDLSGYSGDHDITFYYPAPSTFMPANLDDILVTTEVSQICADISLKTGWNLITIPVKNSWMASTLAENITGCQMISWFDAQNQTFKTHIVGVPGYDFEVKDGVGYFVYVDQNSTLTVCGPRIDNVSVPIYIDWNSIGWYHDYNTTASSLGENITGCSMVSWFDAEYQTFKTHIVGVPGYDFTIAQGMGLFVYVDEASVWYGEG